MQHVVDAYKHATRRLILLDYDGTLVNIAGTPELAQPTPHVVMLLDTLARDPKNELVVISGRDQKTMDKWFGKLPIALSAEHGFFTKPIGKQWQAAAPLRMRWRTTVRTIMTQADRQLPGSFIEEKRSTIAWHYRLSNQAKAKYAVPQLVAALRFVLARGGLRILLGHKVVEVQPNGINKGDVASMWLDDAVFDFVLAAGDDITDERIFDALPDTAYTIKIGEPPTSANLVLPTPANLLKLLDTCSKA